MKAKEMFEKLGYSVEEQPNFYKLPNDPYIVVRYIIPGLVHSERNNIVFYRDETYNVTCNVDMELHQAINKQIEELGW